jgi:FSR family fosmidomycin resistance protein-like MFS transporter
MLLMFSIAIRSVIGLTIYFPWKTNVYLLIFLTFSIAIGKVFGGILADRVGLMKAGLLGLLLAIPLLTFGATNPVMGLVGVFVFNFTMPVTLVAISNALPGRAGLSFGITTLALFIGAVPTFTHYKEWFKQEWVVFTFILLAAVFLYIGLRAFMKQKNALQQ